jgi:hypothetical protein
MALEALVLAIFYSLNLTPRNGLQIAAMLFGCEHKFPSRRGSFWVADRGGFGARQVGESGGACCPTLVFDRRRSGCVLRLR